MTRTQTVLATLVYSPLNHTTQLLDREYFIEFGCRASFNLYIASSFLRQGYQILDRHLKEYVHLQFVIASSVVCKKQRDTFLWRIYKS
jgi:hypothetical protein